MIQGAPEEIVTGSVGGFGHLELMSFKAGEGELVGTVGESFMWEVRFELDLLKGGSSTWEAPKQSVKGHLGDGE